MHLEDRIQELLTTDEAPWADHRIITLGNYSDGTPDGMLTEAEQRMKDDFDAGSEEWLY